MVATGPVAIALLGAVAFAAIVAVCVEEWRARAARRAGDQRYRESVARATILEADSRLADDVAHGLNDLLTAITGHAELLIASLPPASACIQDARDIQRAALSAARLTRTLRTLSSGHRAPVGAIDVNAVTAHTIASLQPMLGPNILVALTLENDIKWIRVGASHLDEILLTLCMHARDAMPGGGRLTVATSMHTCDGRDNAGGMRGECVRLVVADTGGGMSAVARSKLFDPSAHGDDAAGHAAGLAKVDVIVKQAGGRIQVESAAGVGTTFTIDLPAAPAPAAPAEAAPVHTRPVAPVLVVEDEPGMREFIRLVLTRAGHAVVTVAGPRAALATLSRQPAITLMLADVVMPEMDGYEMAAEARKIAPGIQIVFTSAFAPDPARHPSGDDFLAKPFTSELLTSIVEKALAR